MRLLAEAYHLVHNLALSEHEHGRYGHYAEFFGEFRVVVHIDFPDDGFALVILRQFLNDGNQHFARAAPRRPEVDHHKVVGRNDFIEIGVVDFQTMLDKYEYEKYEINTNAQYKESFKDYSFRLLTKDRIETPQVLTNDKIKEVIEKDVNRYMKVHKRVKDDLEYSDDDEPYQKIKEQSKKQTKKQTKSESSEILKAKIKKQIKDYADEKAREAPEETHDEEHDETNEIHKVKTFGKTFMFEEKTVKKIIDKCETKYGLPEEIITLLYIIDKLHDDVKERSRKDNKEPKDNEHKQTEEDGNIDPNSIAVNDDDDDDEQIPEDGEDDNANEQPKELEQIIVEVDEEEDEEDDDDNRNEYHNIAPEDFVKKALDEYISNINDKIFNGDANDNDNGDNSGKLIVQNENYGWFLLSYLRNLCMKYSLLDNRDLNKLNLNNAKEKLKNVRSVLNSKGKYYIDCKYDISGKTLKKVKKIFLRSMFYKSYSFESNNDFNDCLLKFIEEDETDEAYGDDFKMPVEVDPPVIDEKQSCPYEFHFAHSMTGMYAKAAIKNDVSADTQYKLYNVI